MQSTIARLALFQFLAVIYLVLGIGTLLKISYEDFVPVPVTLATCLRDYGFLLMILPALWLICATVSANRPKVGTGDVWPILASGISLLAALLMLGIFGTFSACRPLMHVVVVKQEPPVHQIKQHGVATEAPP